MKNSITKWLCAAGSLCALAVLLSNHSAQAGGLTYTEVLRLWFVDGQFHVWQPGSGPTPTPIPEPTLTTNPASVAKVFSWNPAGTRLAISSADALHIWDFASSKFTEQIPDAGGGDVAWSPDGKWLAVNNQSGLQIRDAQTGNEVQTCGKFNSVSNIAWSPDSRFVVVDDTNSLSSKIIFCEVGSESISTIQPAYWPSFLAFSPDGKKLAAISDAYDLTSYVRIYDSATRQLDATLKGFDVLAWSPDAKRLATITSDEIQIRDAVTYLPLVIIPRYAQVLAWRPGAGRLISANGEGTTLYINDTVTGALLATIPDVYLGSTVAIGRGTPNAIQWAPDGSKFAVLDVEGAIRIFTESGTAPVSTPSPSPAPLQLPIPATAESRPPDTAYPAKLRRIDQVAVSDARYAWSMDGSATFLIYHPHNVTLGELDELTPKPSSESLIRLANDSAWAVSPDGKYFAVASSLADTQGTPDNERNADADILQIWPVDPTLHVSAIPDNEMVWAISWSPDGKWIVVLGTKGQVSLWDAMQKKRVWTNAGLGLPVLTDEPIIWRSDSRGFAIADTGALYFVDPVQPGNVQAWLLPNVTGPIAWSPDETKVAAATDYGLVRVWDVRTQQLIDTIKGHYSQVYQIVWSPDNRTLASISADDGIGISVNLIIEDTSARKQLANLTDFSILATRMGWQNASQLIISELDVGRVRLYDVQSGTLKLYLQRSAFMAAALSADGRWFAYAFRDGPGDTNIHILDTASGQTVATLPSSVGIDDLQWSPSAHQLMSSDENNNITLWSDR